VSQPVSQVSRGNQTVVTNVQLRLLSFVLTSPGQDQTAVTPLRREHPISMATIPATTRSQIARRRSTRMALSAPLGLSGDDSQKCPFTMPAKATNLNRYGAAIHVARQLLVGSTVTVRNTRGTQIPARVVAQLAGSQGFSVYGIEFTEPNDVSNGFWGISFPPLENRGATAQVAEQAGIVRRRHKIVPPQASIPSAQPTAHPR